MLVRFVPVDRDCISVLTYAYSVMYVKSKLEVDGVYTNSRNIPLKGNGTKSPGGTEEGQLKGEKQIGRRKVSVKTWNET